MEYNEKLRFHGGMFGAWLPMLIFVVVMLIAALTKHVNLLIFSAGAFAALCVGFFLAKDKKMFDKVVINGVKNEMLAIILLAYLLAGIMSQLLRQSGLISGLVWLSSTFNLNAGFLPVIAFLTCVVVSTSCGTTGGTITAVTPIMLPLAVGLGIAGLVVDGCVRDIEESRQLDFPIFARGTVCGAGDKAGPGEINFPVACGGVVVRPGDIVLGDADGVVVVPKEDIEAVIAGVDKKLAAEAKRHEGFKQGIFLKNDVDALLEKNGFQAD